MACEKCNYRGYLEHFIMANNVKNVSVRMCPHCKDIGAYSGYVKDRYSLSSVKDVPVNKEQVLIPVLKKDTCTIYDMSNYFTVKQLENLKVEDKVGDHIPDNVIFLSDYKK